MGTRENLPEAAYAAALAHLPAVGPAWLAGTVQRHRPSDAWAKILSGAFRLNAYSTRSAPEQLVKVGNWSEWAACFDVAALWRRCTDKGITVTWPGDPHFPKNLCEGPSPVGVLFVAGDMSALRYDRSVAIIGSRNCSSEGRDTAYEMAYSLARVGVCVISGLALGIDGAAHAGALSAMSDMAGGKGETGLSVGVSGSGVDVIYPRKHAGLWAEMTRRGAIVAETPPGAPAQSWRFPARNRIIAALSTLLVVIECHAKSGVWHTVTAVHDRGGEVAAVPGPVRSPYCAGSNWLLREGAHPVRHAQDVLDELGQLENQAPPSPPSAEPGAGPSKRARRMPASQTSLWSAPPAKVRGPVEEQVLRAFTGRSLCLDEIVERSGLPVKVVAVTLDQLQEDGALAETSGWWSRRV